ncbi:MAG: DNA-binding protein [Gemmatimonadetes bacterium]|nr:DNA-binding protein [Gemmatimonadota bacterium]
MDRVFLDANVLFSPAYRADAGLIALWKLPDARLVTSRYAAEEARINLDQSDQRSRLERLLAAVELVEQPALEDPLPDGIDLPTKDRPILAAAIRSACTHLVTGDVTHFRPVYGRTIAGVRILLPSAYLRAKSVK